MVPSPQAVCTAWALGLAASHSVFGENDRTIPSPQAMYTAWPLGPAA
jgi:hypothetical protein